MDNDFLKESLKRFLFSIDIDDCEWSFTKEICQGATKIARISTLYHRDHWSSIPTKANKLRWVGTLKGRIVKNWICQQIRSKSRQMDWNANRWIDNVSKGVVNWNRWAKIVIKCVKNVNKRLGNENRWVGNMNGCVICWKCEQMKYQCRYVCEKCKQMWRKCEQTWCNWEQMRWKFELMWWKCEQMWWKWEWM